MKKRILLIALAGYLITALVDSSKFGTAIRLTGSYLLEMVKVLPAVFVLSALLLVWVPRELIIKTLGAQSGWKGRLLSLLFGSLSAGPIYAAFPVAAALLSKGASLANVVIIISSWAVVKVPMLIVESSFLGLKFATARYLLTVPTILAIGYITPLLVEGVKQQTAQPLSSELAGLLPGLNCGACGFATCSEYARHVLANPGTQHNCKADPSVKSKLLKSRLPAEIESQEVISMKRININTAEVFTNKRGMQAKMVLNEASFQVVDLHLEAGEQVPSHKTPVDVFFLIRRGQGTVVIGSEEQSVGQDDVIFSPANIPHALRADHNSELDVLIVKAPNPGMS